MREAQQDIKKGRKRRVTATKGLKVGPDAGAKEGCKDKNTAGSVNMQAKIDL